MAERSFALRIAIKDVEDARARLRSLGDEGSKALEQIERRGSPTNAALQSISGGIDRLGSTVTRATRLLGGLGLAFGAVGVADLVRDTFRANVAFESVTRTLNAASGSARGGAESFAFVRAEADRPGH